jgi:transcriptional regulator with PAS, ATPase and Fis domain
MTNLHNPEYITFIFSVLGGIITFFSVIWMKIVKPIFHMIDKQDDLAKSVETIKKEVTTNGGNSIKDAIIDLKNTCNRIENRQKIVEQRTKAALHYNNAALFETDEHGRLVWTNSNFYDLTCDSITSVEGYDWLTYIQEQQRENFFQEFKSCLEMNRKFIKITTNCNGEKIKFIGFPYKINDKSHGGFIINLSLIKE